MGNSSQNKKGLIKFSNQKIEEGKALMDQCKYSQALKFFQNLQMRLAKEMGKKYEGYAHCLMQIGEVLCHLGQYQASLNKMKEAMSIYEEGNGSSLQQQYAESLKSIGNVLHQMRMFDKAREYFSKSLTVTRTSEGLKSKRCAKLWNNLGLIDLAKNENREAVQKFEMSLNLFEELDGKDSIAYMNVLGNMGVAYYQMQNFEESLKLHKLSLSILEKNYGKNHLKCSKELNNMGNVLDKLGKYDESLYFLRKCLKLEQGALGDNHPEYQVTLKNISNTELRKREN